MRDSKLAYILKGTPEKDHKEAIRRIVVAEALGWREISAWTWLGKPTLEDLAGIAVKSDGRQMLCYLLDLDDDRKVTAGAD